MKVRVINEDGGAATRVEDTEGVPVEGVVAVTWTHQGGDLPRVDVQLMFVPFDAEGEAHFIGPNGKEVTRIEYADGTAEDYPAPAP